MDMRQSCMVLCLLFNVSASGPLSAQLEGSLFTTPEERAYLDVLRSNYLNERLSQGFDIDDTELLIPAIEEEETQPGRNAPVYYSLGGIMSQRDGTLTIWLNNRPLAENTLPSSARIVDRNGVLVLQFNTPAGIRLVQPGQTLELNSGTVMENWQRDNSSPAALLPAPAPETPDPGTTPVQSQNQTPAPEPGIASAAPPPAGNTDAALDSLPASLLNDPEALAEFIEVLNDRRARIDYGDGNAAQ